MHTRRLWSPARACTPSPTCPATGDGGHIDYLDLLKRVQAGGKAVQVWGAPDEIKLMHRELRPDKVFYCTSAAHSSRGRALLEWFVRNT